MAVCLTLSAVLVAGVWDGGGAAEGAEAGGAENRHIGEWPVIWFAWNIPFLKRSGEGKADRCVWEGGPFADPESFPQREGRQMAFLLQTSDRFGMVKRPTIEVTMSTLSRLYWGWWELKQDQVDEEG